MSSEQLLDGVLSQDWNNVFKDDRSYRMENQLYTKSQRFRSSLIKKPKKNFCTLSSYVGQWDQMGMAGFGVYTYPHDVEYTGNFEEGVFHGTGTLKYPKGHRLLGVWEKGKLISFKFIFPDGLEYDDPWDYCKMPDRRFQITRVKGFQPADKEYLTNEQPTRVIPECCYDTGDGFYNPKTKCVLSPEEPKKVIRKIGHSAAASDLDAADSDEGWNQFLDIPTKEEEKYIMRTYRKAWDEPTLYRPDLYENWITGRKAELDELEPDEKCEEKAFYVNSKSSSDNVSISVITHPQIGSEFQLNSHNLEINSRVTSI